MIDRKLWPQPLVYEWKIIKKKRKKPSTPELWIFCWLKTAILILKFIVHPISWLSRIYIRWIVHYMVRSLLTQMLFEVFINIDMLINNYCMRKQSLNLNAYVEFYILETIWGKLSTFSNFRFLWNHGISTRYRTWTLSSVMVFYASVLEEVYGSRWVRGFNSSLSI